MTTSSHSSHSSHVKSLLTDAVETSAIAYGARN